MADFFSELLGNAVQPGMDFDSPLAKKAIEDAIRQSMAGNPNLVAQSTAARTAPPVERAPGSGPYGGPLKVDVGPDRGPDGVAEARALNQSVIDRTAAARTAPPEFNPAQARSPNFMERLSALGRGYEKGGLVGGIGDAFGVEDRGTETENLTVQALMKRGLDQNTATSVARNPHLLQSVAPTVFGAGKLGMNPIWGTDSEGNIVLGQMSPSGEVVRSKLPPNFNPSAKNLLKVDGGTEWHMIDPVTRQVVQRVPKDVAGAAAAREEGKDTGTARAGLGNALAKGQYALDIVDKALKHPGRSTGTGFSSIVDPRNYIAGTNAKNFHILNDQMKGQSFLEAYQQLRGGGHISNVEGDKATAAIARLSTSQSDKEYRRGLEELREIVVNGMNRARAKASGGASAAAASADSAAALAKARAAIDKGADKNAVIERLRSSGIDPAGL